MFHKFTFVESVIVLMVSCVISIFTSVSALQLRIAPKYSDFIVGYITWGAQTKFQDLMVFPVFIATLLLSVWALSRLIDELKIKYDKRFYEEFITQLLGWSILPVIAIVSLLFLNLNDSLIYPAAGLIGIGIVNLVIILATTSYSLWRQQKPNTLLVGIAIFSVFLIALLPLEIALLSSRILEEQIGEINVFLYQKVTYFLIVAGILAVTVLAFCACERLQKWLPKLLLVGQIGLLLLFITLYPAPIITLNGVINYTTTIWMKLLLLGLLLWGLWDIFSRYNKYYQSNGKILALLLSPIAIFGFFILFIVSNTIPPNIPADDYHFGERLIGWWSWYQHNKIPYIDYISSHGLVDNDLSSFLSTLLYDGTAATILDAHRLALTLLALIAYLSIYYFSNSLRLAFVTIFFLSMTAPLSLSWLFLTPFFCLWLSQELRRNPAQWLGVWILTVPIVILGAPPQGILLVGSTVPIALLSVWHFWVQRKTSNYWFIVLSIGLVLVGSLLMPLLPMLLGAVRYVAENGSINQIAYGIPWELSWNGKERSGLVFETIRMSWIAIPFIASIIVFRNYMECSNRKIVLPIIEASLPAVAVLLFILFLIPYSMGRIDANNISRPGLSTLFGWTVLIPVLIWPLLKPNSKDLSVILIVVASILLTSNITNPLLLFSKLFFPIPTKIYTSLLRQGQSVGLVNLGLASVQEDHWDRLIRLNALLSEKLSPTETYLDLTNRNAHYFYLNRVPPIAVTAFYNMASIQQQQRAVNKLSHNIPRLALLEANNLIFDGVGLSLRTPLLYRFIVDHYIPAWEKGFIIGYKRDDQQGDTSQTLHIPIKNFTDTNWDKGIHRQEAAVIVDDPSALAVLAVGSEVLLVNGERRHITRIWREGNALWLDGLPLDSSQTRSSAFIEAIADQKMKSEYRLALFDTAFAVARDLDKLPVAWGKSNASLTNKMELVRDLNQTSPTTYHLALEPEGQRITGDDPRIIYNFTEPTISGRQAGLLKFDFSCLGKKAEPKLQIFWWGDGQPTTETSSLRFSADNGTLIVPLDAYPRWLTLKRVEGFRIDLDNATACDAIFVKDIALYQRNSILFGN